uniref:Uncharacterized protein n=1 Tax=Cacopsylla melanoneura TaxID=428564 RepID=A0A8D9FDS1_9HEMI
MQYLHRIHLVLIFLFQVLVLECQCYTETQIKPATKLQDSLQSNEEFVTSTLQHLLVCRKYSENGQRRSQCSLPTRREQKEQKLRNALSELSRIARKWRRKSNAAGLGKYLDVVNPIQ